MTDLLKDLKAGSGAEPHGLGRYRAEEAESSSEDEHMDRFFSKVKQIRQTMGDLTEGQTKLRRLHEDSKTAVAREKMHEIREQMAEQTDKIRGQAQLIKNDLDYLDAENKKALQRPGNEMGSSAERTRTSITNGLKAKLAELNTEFSSLRTTIVEQHRGVVERRYYTITGEKPSDDQLDRLIQTGEADNLFKKAILTEGRGRLVETINEINERHEGVKDIVKGLMELNQIFMDMAVLVEQQGVQLNNIEKSVQRAVVHVHKGTEQLQQAKRLSQNTRKWMCIGLIILLIILAVIVVSVIQPWKSGDA